MSVRRVYVEKKPAYAVKAHELKEEIASYLGIETVTDVRVLIRYDIENLSEETYKTALETIFSEPPVDEVYEETFPRNENDVVFAVEYLPGQFDQRADSAEQCVKLLKEDEEPVIKSATTYVISGTVTEAEAADIKSFCINPVDSRETDETKPETLLTVFETPADVIIFDAAYRWISDGTGTFTVEEAPDQADIKRGPTIRAFIKEGDKEFLEKYRIEGIIRTHSSFIPFPILVDGERVNTTPALWREPKFSIKKEQYDEFYKFLTYDQKDPLDVLHLSVDAPVQFNALLFIPDITKDYFGAYREHWGLDLYARRVLIQRENKELIPDYLAFLKGVVDTEDLPLNISRETLQENIVLRKISQTISKQILSHLEKMAKDDAEKYNSFWKLHGKVFKLGYSDFVNRDRITPLLRFNSSAMEDAGGLTSLDDYISRARESQKEIWYVAAPSREAAKVNPHSEVFRRKGLEA